MALPAMLEHDRKRAEWSVGQDAWRLGVGIREYREIDLLIREVWPVCGSRERDELHSMLPQPENLGGPELEDVQRWLEEFPVACSTKPVRSVMGGSTAGTGIGPPIVGSIRSNVLVEALA